LGDDRRMVLAWSTDGRQGDWLVPRVRGFALDVGSVVPRGFASYARVFIRSKTDPSGAGPNWPLGTIASLIARCSST
jgi:hypothetical protein